MTEATEPVTQWDQHSSGNGAKTRAEPHTDAAHGMGTKGTFPDRSTRCKGGLRIHAVEASVIAGATSHKAGHIRGTYDFDIAIGRALVPVLSDYLHTTGISTTYDMREDGTLFDFDLCCAVRPDVMITTGMPGGANADLTHHG